MVNIKVTLQPLRVPNYVLVQGQSQLKQDGFKEPEKYHLSQLGYETLDELCRDFRAGVFEKAGIKDNPPGGGM